MGTDSWQNLVEMFFGQASRLGDAPMLWQKKEGEYQSSSWREVAEDVARLAWSLEQAGVEAGDRVVIVSESRREWVIADLAIMAAGGISVPTYITNTTRDHTHILENSGAKAAVVSTRRLARALLPAAHESDSLQTAFCMEPPNISQSLNVDIVLWDEAINNSQGEVADYEARAKEISRDDVCCLIYTSGTGGAPKGVMLHHGSILHNCAGALGVLEKVGAKDDVFLSFLPLSHAYEHTGGLFLPIYLGAQIYYAEGLDKLTRNIAEVRPTIMTVVPRLFELLQSRVIKAVQDQGGIRFALFERAMKLGRKRYEDPSSLSALERLQDKFLDVAVRSKIRRRFGGRIKALVAGGAPLNPECGLFFTSLGIRLLQGYGQTESGPIITVNDPNLVKLHTVGPPIADTELAIADDGEIIVRGELVMKGYWRDEDATANAIRDGWLHTGDIGVIDEDGHLEITDRKKDIIVNDKGENVSPSRLEGILTLEPEISQAMIYGDRKPYLVALVVPDADWLAGWAVENGKDATKLADLVEDPDLYKHMSNGIGRINKRVSTFEKIRIFAIVPEPFTIENEQMTPTMKIRRHVIASKYQEIFDSLY